MQKNEDQLLFGKLAAVAIVHLLSAKCKLNIIFPR